MFQLDLADFQTYLTILVAIFFPLACLVFLIIYRFKPRAAWYPSLRIARLVLFAEALAALALIIFSYVTLNPNDQWAFLITYILAMSSLPVLVSAVVALFLKPSAPVNGDNP
jgi:hypothetical protein